MVNFTFTGAFAALAALAAAQPVETASKGFDVKLLAEGGVPANHGRFLATFHTGAGTNAAIGLKNKADAVGFSYNATAKALTFKSTLPYAIGLTNDTPFNSSASDYGFKVVTINAGEGTSGFYPSADSHGEYLFKSEAFPNFDTFVLCKVNRIAPYFSEGPQYQLLWRPKKADAIPACSDITFKAA